MNVDKSKARVRRMFGEIAGRYDFLNHLLSLNADRYWRWRVTRRVRPRGEAPVLDLCTGTGDLAIAFYRAGHGMTKVVGADFCHEMLAIGKEKARRIGADGRISFVEADVTQLPFADDAYEIVAVAFGLRNVADTEQGLREMVRVCRPGGRVVVLEFSTPRWQPFGLIYGWYFRRVLPKIGNWLTRTGGSDAYSYLPESVGEFPSGPALAEWMARCGLRDVHYHALTLGISTMYIGTKPEP